jgi:filamentous hemagglutinin family protein
MKQQWHFSLYFLLLWQCNPLSPFQSIAHAQISTDGSLGQANILTGPDYQIGAELGQQYGTHLFHSFQVFNINAGESATFSGSNELTDVIARITGGETSVINGQLRSTIPDADLYLLNPAGFLFGPQARLDVLGGFHVSTADYLRFADHSRFYADLGEKSQFTTAPLESFGFLGKSAYIDIVGSQLEVAPEHTLSVIGGEITAQSGGLLRSASGRLNIAATQGKGEVTPTADDLQLTTGNSLLSLNNSRLETDDFVPDSSREWGTAVAYIRAGDIVMENQAFIGGGTLIPEKIGQKIDIRADSLTLSGFSRILNISEQQGGRAGDMVLHVTEKIALSDGRNVNNAYQGTRLSASTFSGADGGDILINTKNLIVDNGARIESQTDRGVGVGGHIIIQAEHVTLQGASADGVRSRISTDSFSTQGGAAGAIQLDVVNLELLDGGVISSFSRFAGDGGVIALKAKEKIQVRGATSGDNQQPSAILATSELLGNSGDIVIQAEDLYVLDGGQISTATGGLGRGGTIYVELTGDLWLQGEYGKGTVSNINASGQYSPLFLNYFAPNEEQAGQSGDIQITANRLVIRNGARISNTIETNGRAGDIVIHVADSVSIVGKNSLADSFSSISSDSGTDTSAGEGMAGNIVLVAYRLSLRDQAAITTKANTADGGSISITTNSLTTLRDSRISTSVGDSVGSGGNIVLNPLFLVLDNSPVIARAVGGPGGNIQIATLGVYRFPLETTSPIDASSQRNVDGVVSILTPEINLSDGLVVLSSQFFSAEESLQPACYARLAEHLSSLVVKDREGFSTLGSRDLIPSGILPVGVVTSSIPAAHADSAPEKGMTGLLLAYADLAQLGCGRGKM